MKILIDGDACPVIKKTEVIAESFGVPVVIFCDTCHLLESGYSTVIYTDKGSNSVDFSLIGRCEKGDIVITKDYGLAAMALAKEAYAIHSSGFIYRDRTLGVLLEHRHMKRKAGKKGKHIRSLNPYTKKSNFEKALTWIIENSQIKRGKEVAVS
ncbi:MAG: DUF188 domain-containing protein [Eubacteriales bacterium]|nr:DUF188 domain-containing protein [Eubacteriales bacterium]